MKDLRKDVNYDLSNCNYEQLDSICIWLMQNDKYWTTQRIVRIKSHQESYISFIKSNDSFCFSGIYNQTICATTLFDNTEEKTNIHRFNVDKEIEALMEASKKQGLKAIVTFELLKL